MVDWPSTLAREIAKERCIFFLGAGVSASCIGPGNKTPPCWSDFLKLACGLVTDLTAKDEIVQLINQNKFLIALQAIKDSVDPSAYHQLLNKTYNVAYKPNKIHELIYDLDAKVVITTNFDKIYESYCLSYSPDQMALHKIVDYTCDSLADELRDDTRLLIRAHGSINNIHQMIFTRAEYHEAKRKHVAFYEVLKALILTNTLVFIGCSLEDPDILLLLEEVKTIGRHEKPHYALTRSGGSNRHLVNDWLETYNIKVLEYGPSHDDLSEALSGLLSEVEEIRTQMVDPRAVV